SRRPGKRRNSSATNGCDNPRVQRVAGDARRPPTCVTPALPAGARDPDDPYPMTLDSPHSSAATERDQSVPAAPDWHTLAPAETEARLESGPAGLSPDEAALRRARHGPNRLAPPRRPNVIVRLLRQFNSILIYVMLAACVITGLLGHWVDTGVMFAAVVINVVIGFIQEGKAEAALDAIRAMLAPHATVVRDGVRHEI